MFPLPEPAHRAALIVGGGTSPGPKRLRQLAQRFPLIIAADSGIVALQEAQLTPALVTGDFDSTNQEQLAEIPSDRLRHNPDQSNTDLEKAIELALEMGVTAIALAGVSGDRIDHTINAISLMHRYSDRAIMEFHDTKGFGQLVTPPGLTFTGQPGDRVSLVPAPGTTELTTSGLKYAFSGTDLFLGSRDGISNELTLGEASIFFEEGSLLLYRQLP
jgi:thiamine pyrophosphokinase